MELFHRAKAVRLQGYHNKYLVADDDEVTVRQSHNGSSSKARWTIEYVEENPNAIRLKSCHGLYLSATNEAFLLGMTGKKVQQYPHQIKPDRTTIWEPIREGLFHVKLQTSDGKFLRANGGTPPWRNSVTHDIPHRTATQDWVLWGVDVVDISLSDDTESVMSSLSSFSSVVDDYCGSPDTGSPLDVVSQSFKDKETKLSGGMEFFWKAKSVRLKSHHDKYLLAEIHGENVLQDRQGTTKSAIWMVEFVDGFNNVVRLKSINGKYLTASEDQKILGVTGRKVVQSMPQKLDSSIEWEPIRDGFQVRMKTRYGNYLRANGGLPPWRNSITHDIPYKHHNWILWDVEIVEARPEEEAPPPPPSPPPIDDEVVVVSSETMNADLNSSSFRLTNPRSGRTETNAKTEGRMIYYTIADDDGHVADEERWFAFKGHGLDDLTRNLEEQTEFDDIIVCSRNPLNGKLFPLRLALPPNNSTMHVVVVPPTSKAAKDFLPVST
ncbi:uncharacterized protein LOC112512473 [Cynara cardunculus var. scolymus]|uniref:uncharacterized protein LOC112512473 n=1 Tax=Cynara cardunculus var. scolymus TaxID=59895 RepID=UPI000D628A8E|nr:uncharacterized protein LOC112512473 [Cynara cardunculus var. scolymus]